MCVEKYILICIKFRYTPIAMKDEDQNLFDLLRRG